ncbi:MAG TPA: hypothetical protein GX696_10305, partial [Pseudomonadaceae bacterium]|nr:hypothetical protein [Pseudomonadaceae bacterium]
LRKRYSGFWPDRYVHEGDAGGQEILWINTSGEIMQPAHWGQHHSRCLGYLVACAEEGLSTRLLVLFNAGNSPISFRLPLAGSDAGWQLLLDTGLDDGCSGLSTVPVQGQYSMLAHTTVIMLHTGRKSVETQQEFKL